MDAETLKEMAADLALQAAALFQNTEKLANASARLVEVQAQGGGGEPFLGLFTIFVLSCFIGFYVVWSVTPALHSPLMAVTNAISSVIIVGALIAAGPEGWSMSKTLGGFAVTNRMLAMYKKKKPVSSGEGDAK